ncbi:CycL protein [Neorhizobium galegae bv. orientalis]|nr:CycL protein [Neorhizobium galegae bv. orientalis]
MANSRTSPPSALPGISPSRGEIDSLPCPAPSKRRDWSNVGASCQSPPLRGRCPAGQRGVFWVALAMILALLAPLPAFAVNPDEVLTNPVLEQRARNLSAQLRCMVCQNQSIDDSNAELARDLRVLVRERLTNGDTDGQVIDYVVSRYGEFVLLKPRLSAKTIILWAMPVLLLLVGAIAILVFVRTRPSQRAVAALSPEEQARIEELLKK